MNDSEELNQIYLDARKDLTDARLIVAPNSDEDLEIAAAIDELDLANLNRINAAFSEGTNKLNSLAAKLQALSGKIEANPVGGALEKVNSALTNVNSLASKISDLASSNDEA